MKDRSAGGEMGGVVVVFGSSACEAILHIVAFESDISVVDCAEGGA